MARRLLAWLLVTPLAGGGILAAHAVAYRLTATNPGATHEYLAHAPQVVVVLATLGLAGLALQERSLGPPPLWAFTLLGPIGFVCQEHLERIVHTGELPVLVTTPTFLLGLALQVPVALVCAVVARRIAGSAAGARRAAPPLVGGIWLPLSTRLVVRPAPSFTARPTGRGPPGHLIH